MYVLYMYVLYMYVLYMYVLYMYVLYTILDRNHVVHNIFFIMRFYFLIELFSILRLQIFIQ